MTDKLSAALALVERGFAVFPLAPNSKQPRAGSHGYKDATRDVQQIRQWWSAEPNGNIGVSTDGYVVVDVDKRKDGFKTFRQLHSQHEFPKTARSDTWSGGIHAIYLAAPGEQLRGGTDLLGRGIDIKACGGYIVGPGSEIDGKPYVWGNDNKIVLRPQFIADRCNAVRGKSENAGKRIIQEDEAAVALAREWMERQPGAEWGAIDDTEYKLAARCYDFGCGVDTVEELLTEWCIKHDIPTPPERLRTVVNSAGRNRENAIGVRHPSASGFEPVDISPQPDLTKVENRPQPEIKPVTFGQLDTEPDEAVEYLIPGLIMKRQVTFLSAPGGRHKSRIGVHWGRALHHSLPVYGRPTQRATFVYISCEDDRTEVRRRAKTLRRRLNLPADDTALYWDLVGQDCPLAIVDESGKCKLQPFWGTLSKSLKTIPGHKFLLLDGTYDMLQFAGNAKVNESSVKAAIKLLTLLGINTDSTILSLWHPSQAGQERGDASGWSVAWHNVPRCRLSLTTLKDREDAVELRVEKNNSEPKGPPITLYWDDGLMLPRSEVAIDKQKEDVTKAVVRVAIKAASLRAPMTKQRNAEEWEAKELLESTGWPIPNKERLSILATALSRGELTYSSYSRSAPAGYYPPLATITKVSASDTTPEQSGTGVETVLEPGFETML